MTLIQFLRRRQLDPHWPDPAAVWRSRAAYDELESRFATWWRAEAFAIWKRTKPVRGTVAEAYLSGHGIHLAPPSLRFHPGLEHPASLGFHVELAHPTGGSWPALCALVTDSVSSLPLGVFCTYLARDGASLAPIPSPTAILGVCDGGIVRLGEPGGQPSDVLTIGTGIETCLKVAQDSGDAVWATLSEQGLAELDLPRQPQGVLILAGSLPSSRDAAQALAWKLKSQSRRVALVAPLEEMESCGCPWPRSMADVVH